MRKLDRMEGCYYRIKNLYKNTVSIKTMKHKDPEAYMLLQENQKLRNAYLGERCFIVGNGPSIKNQNLSLLENEYVFTVNQSSRNPDFAKIKTTFHFWTDDNLFVIDETNRGDLAIIDIMKGVTTKDNQPICFFPLRQRGFIKKFGLDKCLNVKYISPELSWMYEGFDETFDLTKHIPVFGTVVQFCLIAAIYMGFKEIYLLGCDNTGLINTITSLLNNNDGDNYCYNVSAEEKARMERTAKRNGLEKDTKSYLYNIRDYRILYEYCLKRKIKLFNCSGQTVIDSIPRLHYESVISKGKDDSDEK